MAVFVSTTFAKNGSSVIDAVKQLAENGIMNVELGSIHKHEEGLAQKLNDVGSCYVTHNFFPPQDVRLVLNIASTDEAIRAASVAFIKEAIDFAQKIGAQIYTIHPGFIVDPKGESASAESYDFNFDIETPIEDGLRGECEAIALRSLIEIVNYARGKDIKVAIETQGSISKKDFVLFSRPEDFQGFLNTTELDGLGINLNLGHLHLASKAWGFDEQEFVALLRSRIAVVEVSHNDGLQDDHSALKSGEWYWDILKDDLFKNVPVVFEGRNVSMKEVLDSCNLLQDYLR